MPDFWDKANFFGYDEDDPGLVYHSGQRCGASGGARDMRDDETRAVATGKSADGDAANGETGAGQIGQAPAKQMQVEPRVRVCLEADMPSGISPAFMRMLLETMEKAKDCFGAKLTFPRLEANERVE